MRALFFTLVAVLPLAGQEFKIPESLDKSLAGKAVECVNVNLDSNTLQLASRFLSRKKPEEARAKSVADGLKSILVRSFEFDKPGQYDMGDLEALRRQLAPPAWSRIVSAVSKRGGENTEIYLRSEDGKPGGIVILAAEPKELTIVSITGSIDLNRLSELGGQFGIPKLPAEKGKGDKKE